MDNIWDRIEKAKQAQQEFYERHPEAKPSEQTKHPTKIHNAPLPRALTRTSPFYPVSQAELRDRAFVRHLPIVSNSWGTLEYNGPVLSVFDEDVLLACLALMDEGKGKPTDTKYTYRGPLLPILKYMGYKTKKVGKNDYTRIKESLSLMANASLHLELANGSWEITPLLAKAAWDENKKELLIVCNQYFYDQYVKKHITLLDITERAKLKRPTSKALYRFIMSHQGRTWQSHFMTLAITINLATGRPKRKIRDTLKRAIEELTNKHILTNKSCFLDKDMVYLEKTIKISQ